MHKRQSAGSIATSPTQLVPGIPEVTDGQGMLQGYDLTWMRKDIILISEVRVLKAEEMAGAKVLRQHTQMFIIEQRFIL